LQTKNFAELGLSPKVLAAVEAAGYTVATPIQTQAIPIAISGRDVLGIAQTGTGKTAAFVLPMITRLETGRARARMPRSLIIAPTRELAAQVAQSFEKYGTNHKLDVALLIGGTAMDEQIKKLDRGVDVLIATPGRLLDHFGRGRIMLMGVEILVIDEADRMLDMGFIPDIEKICKLLPPRRQTLFFSATMPPEITRLVDQFLNNPERIEVAPPATTAKTITQRFRFCPEGEDWAKREVLRDLIKSQDVKNAIIFCNRKRDVAILFKSLQKHGFSAGELHGDMDQSARTATLDGFRAGRISLLAASDVAARGLDIPEVSHVFNFDVPWAGDDYVHRIGRTGRAGREGFSATLVSIDDLRLLKDIEKATGETPTWIGDAPTEADFAQSGKKRRGRGAPVRGGRSAGGAGPSGRSEGRSEGRGEARGDDRAGGDREARGGRPPRRDRSRRPAGDDASARIEVADTSVESGASAVSATLQPDRDNRRPPRPEGRRERPAGRPPVQPREQPHVGPSARHDEQPDVAAWPVTNLDEQIQAPRQPRDPRPERGDQRQERGQRPPRGDQPQRYGDARPERAPQAERGPNRDRRPNRGDRDDRGDHGAPTGFADNVPAFLRKTVRAKVAND
jgi:superfamily II DNA/RNA helicase